MMYKAEAELSAANRLHEYSHIKYKKEYDMENYILGCGSTVDLNEKHLKERNIEVLSFHFRLGDKDYDDDFGKSLAYKDLYATMNKGVPVKTSQTTAGEYEDAFTPYLEKGFDIVHVTLSSGISGSYESCLIAKKNLEEKFPERKVYVVDSLCASSGYGMLMDLAADYHDEGHSAAELKDYLDGIKLHLHHLFYSMDLTAYVRGGRISAAAGVIGSLLRICPLMYVNPEGKLIIKKKLIGKKRAVAELISEMLKNAENGENYDGPCYLCNSECIEDANYTVSEIEKNFPALKGKCKIYDIGATIGCHTGTGTVAVFFLGKERV